MRIRRVAEAAVEVVAWIADVITVAAGYTEGQVEDGWHLPREHVPHFAAEQAVGRAWQALRAAQARHGADNPDHPACSAARDDLVPSTSNPSLSCSCRSRRVAQRAA